MEGDSFLQPVMLVPYPMMYMPMSMPISPCAALTTAEQETPEETAGCSETTSSGGSWDDELYTTLHTTSETKNKWHMIERGLFLRANPLPLFGCFYKVEENGEYRHWGAKLDFVNFAEDLSNEYSGLAIVDARTMCAHVYKPKKEELVYPMREGLRYARSYPDLLCLMVTENLDEPRQWSHAEVYGFDEKRPVKNNVEKDLTFALMRSKRQGHICKW